MTRQIQTTKTNILQNKKKRKILKNKIFAEVYAQIISSDPTLDAFLTKRKQQKNVSSETKKNHENCAKVQRYDERQSQIHDIIYPLKGIANIHSKISLFVFIYY